ncbi:ATPase components of ABC transporters with duplicated ATPase domains (Uup) (PDB:5ZXD) [Commensalibacter communis]|uniref:ATP-binding cassette domain-containing protein n=1 Tax=Commensalibacter communis TaxID=2972786 RepID=UPI0022FFB5B0|nr:ATP-binding cassette domain-containing protein [Commensalibacter communis]CAI3946982.1 ATPase components of ABC transporters with duplicated ATPase domains (Uup) (PDB:5ZXD) [Commensalibacter communis]CAI3948301.1 ATPase components of ABC transporters with duplicated ATPase domains (Uup) (PDB:5ZXD) [Commensalibacter communis]
MSTLVINNLTLRIFGRPLLENASLTIENGRKVGLVGRNGTGKSTLLAAIAGDMPIDDGEILIPSRIRMARVKQEAPSGPLSLIDTVLAADQERATLLHEAETIQDGYRLAEVHERLIAINADSAPARAAVILAGLGFNEENQQRPVSDFSGGWRMRVALASTLFLNPDLLLLDEPTNHLDLEATLWLESWLENFSGSALIVSHDRNLLDRSVNAIAHLHQRKLSLTVGGYEEFIRIKNEKALQQNREVEKIAAKRAHMQSFVDRFRAKATKARQAQARLKALEKLPPLQAIVEETPIHFEFPQPIELPPPLITLQQVKAGYGDRTILSGISLRIDPDDRIALLGANGNGKSTFIKLIAGRLKPFEGTIQNNSKLSVGYFAQHQLEDLVPENTPLEHIQSALPKATQTELRGQLARFGLDADRVDTKVNSLSGGEKARLVLALATRHNPNILLLDEPTNHLDLDAKESLVHALSAFNGAVILISHDARLIELVADSLWLVNNGAVAPFDGDIQEYRQWLDTQRKEANQQSKTDNNSGASSQKEARKDRAEKRKLLQPLRSKIKDSEKIMSKCATEIQKLEEKLSDVNFYSSANADEMKAIQIKLSDFQKRQADAEETWLELHTELEAAEAEI